MQNQRARNFKLFTAIEIVFIIFILIVVVLIVIQMVTKYVNPQKINPYIESVEQLAKREYMRQFCDSLCSAVKTATNYRDILEAEARWCFTKITDKDKDFIDIVEDGIPGFFVVGGLPYCENGVYCFNFFSCDAGITLDIKECRRILCEYYTTVGGMTTEQATEFITHHLITPGKCSFNEKLIGNKPLAYKSTSWWHQMYFNDTAEDIKENWCADILAGREVKGSVSETEKVVRCQTPDDCLKLGGDCVCNLATHTCECTQTPG